MDYLILNLTPLAKDLLYLSSAELTKTLSNHCQQNLRPALFQVVQGTVEVAYTCDESQDCFISRYASGQLTIRKASEIPSDWRALPETVYEKSLVLPCDTVVANRIILLLVQEQKWDILSRCLQYIPKLSDICLSEVLQGHYQKLDAMEVAAPDEFQAILERLIVWLIGNGTSSQIRDVGERYPVVQELLREASNGRPSAWYGDSIPRNGIIRRLHPRLMEYSHPSRVLAAAIDYSGHSSNFERLSCGKILKLLQVDCELLDD